MCSLKPEDLIGKYIAYDAPASESYPHGYGSVFAKIIAVNWNSRKQAMLITDNMKVRFMDRVHAHKGKHRVIYFDEIMKSDKVRVFEGDFDVSELEDELFVKLVKGDGTYVDCEFGEAITIVTDDLKSKMQSSVAEKFHEKKHSDSMSELLDSWSASGKLRRI